MFLVVRWSTHIKTLAWTSTLLAVKMNCKIQTGSACRNTDTACLVHTAVLECCMIDRGEEMVTDLKFLKSYFLPPLYLVCPNEQGARSPPSNTVRWGKGRDKHAFCPLNCTCCWCPELGWQT